jgi:CubicO group peptidase (beta-lactamase class C family)
VQSQSATLETMEPIEGGLLPERLEHLEAVLGREVSDGRLPGAVVGILRGDAVAYLGAVGHRDPAAGEAMATDAVFSIASMTKPMVSLAVMQLVEEGRVLLGDPIDAYLPELANLTVQAGDATSGWRVEPAERAPTVQDLLRHTSGLTYSERGDTPAHTQAPGSSIRASVKHSRAEFLERLKAAPLLFQPGRQWEYGFSIDVLGLLVERMTGQTLGEALRQRIWAPLGMVDTAFELSDAARGRYAHAFATDPLSGEPIAVHHAKGTPTQWESGGGGALSTAMDYMRFLRIFLTDGYLGTDGADQGPRVLSRASLDLMTSDHLAPDVPSRIADTMDPAAAGYGFGLGFAVRRQDGVSALHGNTGDFYWSGVYGTYFWVDPAEDLAVVFMAATPGPMRLRYRQLIRTLTYSALAD